MVTGSIATTGSTGTVSAGPNSAPTPEIEGVLLDSLPDLHLTVGSPPAMRIGVSSKRLIEVSKVFERMLGGSFAEGQVQRSPEQPQSLVLGDDDAQAMLDLCKLIYHRAGHLTKSKMSVERLYHLIKVADYYGSIDGLGLQLRALMQQSFDERDRLQWKHYVLRATAAYLLRDAKYFRLATHHLMTRSNETFSGIRELEGGEFLSMRALLVMAERRAKAQRKISCGLRAPADCSDCGSTFRMTDYHEEPLGVFTVDAWPPTFEPGEKVTVAELLDHMKKIRVMWCGFSCDCDSNGNHEGHVDFSEIAEEVDVLCNGLCVLCVREGSAELACDACKH